MNGAAFASPAIPSCPRTWNCLSRNPRAVVTRQVATSLGNWFSRCATRCQFAGVPVVGSITRRHDFTIARFANCKSQLRRVRRSADSAARARRVRGRGMREKALRDASRRVASHRLLPRSPVSVRRARDTTTSGRTDIPFFSPFLPNTVSPTDRCDEGWRSIDEISARNNRIYRRKISFVAFLFLARRRNAKSSILARIRVSRKYTQVISKRGERFADWFSRVLLILAGIYPININPRIRSAVTVTIDAILSDWRGTFTREQHVRMHM